MKLVFMDQLLTHHAFTFYPFSWDEAERPHLDVVLLLSNYIRADRL